MILNTTIQLVRNLLNEHGEPEMDAKFPIKCRIVAYNKATFMENNVSEYKDHDLVVMTSYRQIKPHVALWDDYHINFEYDNKKFNTSNMLYVTGATGEHKYVELYMDEVKFDEV